MTAIRKLEPMSDVGPQEAPTAAQVAQSVLLECREHAKWFPKEEALRPLSEWSHNPVTLQPLRNCCKRCDTAKKNYYTSRKKATSGPVAAESVQRALADMRGRLAALEAETNPALRKEKVIEGLRRGVPYLEMQLAELEDAQ